MKIAFIGLGNMGGPMAINLHKAGHQVSGFDLSEAACKKYAADGLAIAETAAATLQGAEVVVSMLPAINVPTMVVGGRQDTVRPLAGSQEIAIKIPNARFEAIDAGHFMPTTGPAALLALLKDFLGNARG